ncbi:MAG: ubiquinol oxidase subunit II [Candidatus Saccharimonadales bacterium]
MNKKHKYYILGALVLAFLLLAGWYLHSHFIPVLQPRGTVARQERNLIIVALALAALVVVPVYTMTIMIAWKYRASNTKARYTPDWDSHRLMEITWWAIPGAIILVFSIITWNSSRTLDPFRPLSSAQSPLTIQVVALDWKWLFIYPQQKIASVNYLQMPVNVPVNFELTSDSVMNSFWVPALGSQIYTMPGMSTQIHLMATQAGSYRGSSANISGEGFASMDFMAQASSSSGFAQWVKQAQASSNWLDLVSYSNLAKPSQNTPVTYFSHAYSSLYNYVIGRYMAPAFIFPTNGQAVPKTAGVHGG